MNDLCDIFSLVHNGRLLSFFYWRDCCLHHRVGDDRKKVASM